MLERAMFIGMRYNLRRDDEVEQALHCVIHTGAEVCGFADYGLTPGRRAEPSRSGAGACSNSRPRRSRSPRPLTGHRQRPDRGPRRQIAAGVTALRSSVPTDEPLWFLHSNSQL